MIFFIATHKKGAQHSHILIDNINSKNSNLQNDILELTNKNNKLNDKLKDYDDIKNINNKLQLEINMLNDKISKLLKKNVKYVVAGFVGTPK